MNILLYFLYYVRRPWCAIQKNKKNNKEVTTCIFPHSFIWASFLDGMDAVIKLLAFFAAIGSIVAFIMFMVVRGAKMSGESVGDIEPFTKFLRVRYWVPAFLVLSLVAVAIPPKTEMYAMYGADIVIKLADSANLQQAGKDTQEIVHSLSIILKGAAEEIEKPKEKK